MYALGIFVTSTEMLQAIILDTVVIKYQHPKGTRQKVKSIFLIGLIISMLNLVFKILTFWIPIARLDYKGQLDNIEYWYIEIDMETGIPQREIGFDILNSAILFGPTDRKYGFWIDSKMMFDTNQYPIIGAEVFNDIFKAMEKHQLECVFQKIDKYFRKWTDNNHIESAHLPLLIYDLTNYEETFICDSWELFSDSDITGYEWDSTKRVIDARGKVYKTTYINFGHPVGCVYPEKIEETISLDNFKNLLRTNFKKIRDKELKGQTFEELFTELK